MDDKLTEVFKDRSLERTSLRIQLRDEKTDKSKNISFSQFSAYATDDSIRNFAHQLESLVPYTCMEHNIVSTFHVPLG